MHVPVTLPHSPPSPELFDGAAGSGISVPYFIDSSTLSSWRSCRRKYYWQTLKSLYPSGKSVHLIAGGAIAAGMEAARKRVFLDPDPKGVHLDDILHAAFAAFAKEWGSYEAPSESPKDAINSFSALAAYLENFPPATDVIQPLIRPDGSPTVEFNFAIPTSVAHPDTGDPIIFTGRFDLLGSYNGLPAVVDEKTTSQLGFSWANQWALRGQFMGYIWACQQLGYPVNLAVVRGIALLKRDIKFETAIVQFPQHLIDRWHAMLEADLREIVFAYQSLKSGSYSPDTVYPYNFADACSSYGGCAFATLCSAKDPEPYFTNYIHHRWDPLAKTPVKEETPT